MREPGFYWTKFIGDWTISRWYSLIDNGSWFCSLSPSRKLKDSDFEEIDENRIVRQEPVKNANPILQLNDEMNKCGIITPDFVRRRFEQEADKLFNEDGN